MKEQDYMDHAHVLRELYQCYDLLQWYANHFEDCLCYACMHAPEDLRDKLKELKREAWWGTETPVGNILPRVASPDD